MIRGPRSRLCVVRGKDARDGHIVTPALVEILTMLAQAAFINNVFTLYVPNPWRCAWSAGIHDSLPLDVMRARMPMSQLMQRRPMPNQTLDVENSFLRRARYPKGRRTLQAIMNATYEIVISEGIGAASQEAIAKRAKVTQSAVRHYFPTKEELLFAFFSTGIERLQHLLNIRMAATSSDPRTLLIDSVALHYQQILDVEDVYYFEAAAYGARSPQFRALRDRWYQSVNLYYTGLIGAIHPDWDANRCTATAFQVLTLILGGWITLGNSRGVHKRRSRTTLKAMLLDGVERLIA
ncbi:MAG: TetR/AcrR family transcriptional regulator [Gammaproteobacteria bacterium]|nr:TetR/AcrR family transcriptional regulator [Gammaproteobacteria bacterium]